MRVVKMVAALVMVFGLACGVATAGTTWDVYSSGSETENDLLADPAFPTDLLGVRLDTGAGTVNFTNANTYTGGTEVNAGIFRADNASAAGTAGVAVGGSGEFRLHGPTVANNVTLADGGKLYVSADSVLDGDVDVTGTVTIGTTGQYADLTHNGAITGTGGVYFYGTNSNQWNGAFYLYGAGTYDGPTEIARGTHVHAFDADALGNGASQVTVRGGSGYGQGAYLYLRKAAGGLNANKTIRVEALDNAGYRGSLYVGSGVTIGNDITLAGGQLRKAYDGGSEDSVVSSTITLEDVVVGETVISAQLYHGSSGTSMGKTLLNGTIQGTGGLVVSGSNQRDCTFYLNGNNTYQGGTLIHSTAYGTGSRVHVSTDAAFGTGAVELKNTYNTTYYQFVLDADCSMANAFTGTGRIDANGNTFTSTGSMAPGASTGTIDVEDTLDFQGTYYWEYDETSSDLISADTLLFGDGDVTIEMSWIGAPEGAEAGVYELFSYTGPDPVLPTFSVTTPAGGPTEWNIWLDEDTNKIMLELEVPPVAEPGSAALMLLGLASLRRRRS
jgi:fibronectin-binding autotransporter adhesin